ncbi:MAG: hypothetical protein Q9227_006696 [Pyrenula ochraceoflavens]
MAPKEGLTAEELDNVGKLRNVRFAPSASEVVYDFGTSSKKEEHEVSSIWIADVGKEHSARQITSGLFNDHSPEWSPSEDSVTFISDRAKAGESSAIYSLSLHGGEPVPLTPADSKTNIQLHIWSPDGRYIAFLQPDAKTSELEAKEMEKDDAKVDGERWEFNRLRLLHVHTREIATPFADNVHITEFAWKEDSSELLLMTQKNTEVDVAVSDGIELYQTNLLTKQPLKLASLPFYAYDLVWHHGDIYFLAGLTPERAASSSNCVYKLNSENGSWARQTGGQVDCISSVRWSSSGPVLHLLSGLEDEIRCPKEKVLFRKEQKIGAWDISSTEDPILVASLSSPCAAEELFSKSCTSNELCQLSNHSAFISSKLPFFSAEAFRCKASDGTQLESMFLTPLQTQASKPWPTFVQIHGGPYLRISQSFEVDTFAWPPYLLSNSSTAVLCPNYRGSCGWGESFADTHGRMGREDYSDIIDTIKAGVAAGLIDKERVVFGGWSQGGFLSYLSVVRNDPAEQGFTLRGAICGAGVADWDSMPLASDAPAFERGMIGLAPWEVTQDNVDSRHGSAIYQIKKAAEEGRATVPVLILHGEQDPRVPYHQSVGFRRACSRYGIQCEMVSYPREGHFIIEEAHRLDMLKRVRRFVDLHLHAGA